MAAARWKQCIGYQIDLQADLDGDFSMYRYRLASKMYMSGRLVMQASINLMCDGSGLLEAEYELGD